MLGQGKQMQIKENTSIHPGKNGLGVGRYAIRRRTLVSTAPLILQFLGPGHTETNFRSFRKSGSGTSASAETSISGWQIFESGT